MLLEDANWMTTCKWKGDEDTNALAGGECQEEVAAWFVAILGGAKCATMDTDTGAMILNCPDAADGPCTKFAKCMHKSICEVIKKSTTNPAECAKAFDKLFAADCKLTCNTFPLIIVIIAACAVVLIAVVVFCLCRKKKQAQATGQVQ